MQVQLVSTTQPVNTVETTEQLLAYCARVSNPNNQDNHDTSDRLLKYCAKNAHWSVFEMADMTVEITTSRAIAAQILRHKSASFQEWSQRYTEALTFEKYKLRRQDKKNRQNSIDDMPQAWQDEFEKDQQEVWDIAYSKYKKWIDRDAAKEQARFLLPLNTQTRMYMKNSVRGWIHYLQVRTDESTQLEHREIALACQKILLEQFPSLKEVLKDD